MTKFQKYFVVWKQKGTCLQNVKIKNYVFIVLLKNIWKFFRDAKFFSIVRHDKFSNFFDALKIKKAHAAKCDNKK
jgi:hypothetical protein